MMTGVLDVFPLMLIRTAGLPLQWPDGNTLFESEVTGRLKESENRLQSAYLAWKTVLEAEKDRPVADILLQKQLTNLRRLLRKGMPKRLVIIDTHLSTNRPDISLLADNWNQAFAETTAIREELQQSFSVLQMKEWQMLRGAASNETLGRALLFSSHSLLQALPNFKNVSPEQWTKKDRKTASSLAKYLFRACSKTTPFSRLATVSTLDIAQDSEDHEGYVLEKVHTTPNVVLLPFLYEILLKEPVFVHSLKLRLNPSLLLQNAQWEWLHYNGQEEMFQTLGHTGALEHLTNILSEQGGAAPFPDLLAALGEKVDADESLLQSFVLQLVDTGLLEWVWPETGLSPAWCGALYNFLGFLPAAPMLTDAAFLLQWLRSAARVLPFQSIEEAINTQQQALAQCHIFFERYQSVCPPIPAEQLFYEDVSIPVQTNVREGSLTEVIADIDQLFRKSTPFRLTGLRARLLHVARKEILPGQSMPFLEFCKLFLQGNNDQSDEEALVDERHNHLGALVQLFRADTGSVKAVLNALYPGGGKMMARWLHLFPSNVLAALQTWWPENTIPFPWQDWANSNFQSLFGKNTVAVPGGRTGTKEKRINLQALSVQRMEHEIFLTDADSGKRIIFSDLGLEDPADKPPVMRILWYLGGPPVSAALLNTGNEWTTLEKQVRYRSRHEYRSLIVSRAAWMIEKSAWEINDPQIEQSDLEICLFLRRKLSIWQVPRYFFASTREEQPRFFDACSPLLLLELASMLRHQDGVLLITEMLPTPDQWLVERNGQQYASEWVLEWKVSAQSNQAND